MISRAQTDHPHRSPTRQTTAAQTPQLQRRVPSPRAQSDSLLARAPLVQQLPQRRDGRCFYSHPKEFSIRVKNYLNRPDLERIRYVGEWTIICTKHHVHTKACKAAATGRGRVTLPPKRPGQPEVVLSGFFDEGRPSSESVVNPVVEYEEHLDEGEHPSLAPQPIPFPHLHTSRKRIRSDGAQSYEPLQPSPPPSASSVAPPIAVSASAIPPAPLTSAGASTAPSIVELSVVWYPSEGAPNARKMRLFRVSQLALGGVSTVIHATDLAGLLDRPVSSLSSRLQAPSECLLLKPIIGRAVYMLTVQGVRKIIAILGIKAQPLQWIHSVLLPKMEKESSQGTAAAAMEDVQKHDHATHSIERNASGRTRSNSSLNGGAAAQSSASKSHPFDAIHVSSVRNAAAASSASASAAAAAAVTLPVLPMSLQQSTASSSSSASRSSTFFGLIRDDRVRGPISVDDVNARALEAEAATRCGMPSKRAWSIDPFTYRGMLRKTPQGELLRHGLGQSTYDSGSVFIGEYRDGKCNGQGRWTTYDSLGNAHTYEGGWVDDHEEGEGVMQWTDPDLGKVVARGTFVGGLQQGDGCKWTLDSGHVFFEGRMDKGKFAHGRLTFDENNGAEFYVGSIKDDLFHGVGCYAWPDGSFYFGSFRHHERNGLGIFFLPRGDDDLISTDWLTADREPFTLYAAISRQNGVHAMWRRKEDETQLNGSSHAAGSSSSSTPAAAAAAATPAAASASSSSESGDAQLMWQALHRLIQEALPTVLRLQHERKQLLQHSELPPPPDYHVRECVRAALDRFPSPSQFHLISVPNAVHDLRRKGGCSYLITGELGCAEQPYLCLTCADDLELQDESAATKGCSWEMCQACAEKSACHAGHSLRALPPRRRFVCDCGRRHVLLSAVSSASQPQHASSLNSQAADSHSGGASKAAAAGSAPSMDDVPDATHGDADSASPAHVCSGMQVHTNPIEWAKAVWPANVAQAERALQAQEEQARIEAMQ